MTDILVRDLADATVAEIDRRAGAQGLSRAEYLRRSLTGSHRAVQGAVSAADWHRFSLATSDLGDADVMGGAWS